MPYDRDSTKDRARAASHLRAYWPSEPVPDAAVTQFIAIANSSLAHGASEGRAIATGKGVVRDRFHRVDVSSAARVFSRCMTQPVISRLAHAASHCGCGRPHETLSAALHAASRTDDLEGEGERVDMSADMEWAWKRIATDIYRNPDKLLLAVRELWQNSRDAGAKTIEITWRADPGDPDYGTLTFSDDGHGMSKDIYRKVFSRLGGSQKASGSLGGFGAAKAAILVAGAKWDWRMESQDWAVVSTTGGSTQLYEVLNYRKGVKTTLGSISASTMATSMGRGDPRERIEAFVRACDLRGMAITLNGESITGAFAGRRGKREEAFESNRDFGWGRGISALVRSYVRDDEDGTIYVRLGGILQFTYDRPDGIAMKRDYVIDMDITDPEVKPDTPGYPFPAGRDDFKFAYDEGTAYKAYKYMRDTLTKKGAANEKELGEYDTVEPGGTDKREIEQQAKFDEVMSEVLGSDEFAQVFQDLGTVTREFFENTYGGLPTQQSGITLDTREGDESPLAGQPKPEDIYRSELPKRPPANPYAFSEIAAVADPSELLDAVEGWLQNVLGYLDYSTRNAISDLRSGYGTASDLEVLMAAVKDAIAQNANESSDLATGAAISRIAKRLTEHMSEHSRAEVKKRWDQLNPLGGQAIMKFSRERYGVTGWDGKTDWSRRKKFQRSGAKRYVRHLALWDFTARQVMSAVSQATGGSYTTDLARDMSQLKLAGFGFILDDQVNAMASQETAGLYVTINPEIMDAVIQGNKHRPWVIANFVHGLVCHELGHAVQIAVHKNGDHNENWSITRESMAKSTSWLLPAVAAAARKLFRGVHRWTGRTRSSGTDSGSGITQKDVDKAVAEARAGMQVRIDELEHDHNSEINELSDRFWSERRKFEGAEAQIKTLDDAYRSAEEALVEVEAQRDQAAEALERLKTQKIDDTQPTSWFRERSVPLVHALESFVHLQEFREWVRANPALVDPLGISVDRFLAVLDEPGAMTAVLEGSAVVGASPSTVEPLLADEAEDSSGGSASRTGRVLALGAAVLRRVAVAVLRDALGRGLSVDDVRYSIGRRVGESRAPSAKTTYAVLQVLEAGGVIAERDGKWYLERSALIGAA